MTNFAIGLPPSPRSTRPSLALNTNFSRPTTAPAPSTSTSPTATTPLSTASTALPLHSRSSLIFINATIPLSPTSTTTSSSSSASTHDGFLDGLAPRKRSGLVRLLCCFGREERARRRAMRESGFEKVGGEGHWSEY